MTAYDPENIFAKILNGSIPCNEIDQDETTLSFEDINPQAPSTALSSRKAPIPT